MMDELLEKLLLVEDDFEDTFKPASEEEINKRLIQYIESIGCIKNEDGTYSCKGSVDLSGRKLIKLPVKFKEVGGYFDCNNNKLTSLEGAPKEVGRWFGCSNNNLTSLQGAPSIVGGYFDCNNNKLTSLEGAPKEVGRWFGGGFWCGANKLPPQQLKKTVKRDYLR